MMIRSKVLQASVFGALCLVGGMNNAAAEQLKPMVLMTETSATALTPAQFAQLQKRADTLVEQEQKLVAAIQGAKNPGVIATLNKTLCRVVAEVVSLAKTGVVSAAVGTTAIFTALAGLGYKSALSLDPKGFIIRLFGANALQYVAQTPWYTQIS